MIDAQVSIIFFYFCGQKIYPVAQAGLVKFREISNKLSKK
jgi:hypothetical protein